MITTLNAIRAHSPCADGWKKLLARLGKTGPDDEPLSIVTVLDSNGLSDAIWCLRAVTGRDREIRLFAVWCARQVQHLMTDPRSIAALDVAERYAHGDATKGELYAARAAAYAAYAYAADAAAYAAARAAAYDAYAYAAADAAARAAARAAAYDAYAYAYAADAAAYAAARAAAYDAYAYAAYAAARAAAYDAYAYAADAARAAQAAELRRICAALEVA